MEATDSKDLTLQCKKKKKCISEVSHKWSAMLTLDSIQACLHAKGGRLQIIQKTVKSQFKVTLTSKCKRKINRTTKLELTTVQDCALNCAYLRVWAAGTPCYFHQRPAGKQKHVRENHCNRGSARLTQLSRKSTDRLVSRGTTAQSTTRRGEKKRMKQSGGEFGRDVHASLSRSSSEEKQQRFGSVWKKNTHRRNKGVEVGASGGLTCRRVTSLQHGSLLRPTFGQLLHHFSKLFPEDEKQTGTKLSRTPTSLLLFSKPDDVSAAAGSPQPEKRLSEPLTAADPGPATARIHHSLQKNAPETCLCASTSVSLRFLFSSFLCLLFWKSRGNNNSTRHPTATEWVLSFNGVQVFWNCQYFYKVSIWSKSVQYAVLHIYFFILEVNTDGVYLL